MRYFYPVLSLMHTYNGNMTLGFASVFIKFLVESPNLRSFNCSAFTHHMGERLFSTWKRLFTIIYHSYMYYTVSRSLKNMKLMKDKYLEQLSL